MFSSFLPTTFLAAALLFASVGAIPLPEVAERDLENRAVTLLSTNTISNFAPFTQFARAAYCQQSRVKTWNCGGACNSVPGFQPTLTGGDGSDTPLFFVGYWPKQNTVIVSHEGTDPTEFLSVLIDLEIGQVPLDQNLFPGLPGGVMVHQGFRDSHSSTAPTILAEVKRLISTKGANSVVAVGHSLGGALAELETIYLRLNLPSSVSVKGITFGTPRVGNPAWANWFNSVVNGNFNRINHNLDPVPIVPGRGMGYSHVGGEIHIDWSNNWNSCSGNDSTDRGCTINAVPNVFFSNILDHLGAYQSIFIGTTFCN